MAVPDPAGLTTRCWSCEKQVAVTMRCASCGALLPPPGGIDAFAALDLPARFAVDLTAAEVRYKERARVCHPDRLVRADARARVAGAAWSALLNHAWRVVREPFARADAVFSLRGGAELVGADAPPELLMEMMELGETQDEARQAGDGAALAALAAQARAEIAKGFADLEPLVDAPGAGDAELAAAGRILMRLRYWRRFLAEVTERDPAEPEREPAGAGLHHG